MAGLERNPKDRLELDGDTQCQLVQRYSCLQHLPVLLCVREDINNETLQYPARSFFPAQPDKVALISLLVFSGYEVVKHPAFAVILTPHPIKLPEVLLQFPKVPKTWVFPPACPFDDQGG